MDLGLNRRHIVRNSHTKICNHIFAMNENQHPDNSLFDILETVATQPWVTSKYCTFLRHDEKQRSTIQEPEIPYVVNF